MEALKSFKSFNFSCASLGEFEPRTQNGLGLTPAKMLELTNAGFSISARNQSLLDAVDPADKDFYVPLQYRRGFDINDAFEHSRNVRKNVKSLFEKVDKGEINVVPSNAG